MGPEDNPADDVQPTKEEWDEYETKRDNIEPPCPPSPPTPTPISCVLFSQRRMTTRPG